MIATAKAAVGAAAQKAKDEGKPELTPAQRDHAETVRSCSDQLLSLMRVWLYR